MSGEELRAAAQAVLDELDIIRAHRDKTGVGFLVVHPSTHETLRAALDVPSTPEPSGLCPECAHAIAAHTIVTNDGCQAGWCLCEWAAPSTEPALNVERLALAECEGGDHGHDEDYDGTRPCERGRDNARRVAAEYARLAESQS